MELKVKFKNGLVEIKKVKKLEYSSKNPCIRCRKGGGCYDHGCFMPEEWGDFLTSENHSIRLQDVDELLITDLF